MPTYLAIRKGSSPAKILALPEGSMDISWLTQSFRGRAVSEILGIRIGMERKHMPGSSRVKWTATEWGWETQLDMTEETYGALVWGAYWLTENQNKLGQIEHAVFSFIEAVKMGLDEDFAETVAAWDRAAEEARQAEIRRKEEEAAEIERAAAAYRAREQEIERRWRVRELHEKIGRVIIPPWVTRDTPRRLTPEDHATLQKALTAHNELVNHPTYGPLLTEFPMYLADIQKIVNRLRHSPPPAALTMPASTAAAATPAQPAGPLKIARKDPSIPVEWVRWTVINGRAESRTLGSPTELDREFLGWTSRLHDMWTPCQIVRRIHAARKQWSDTVIVVPVGPPVSQAEYTAQVAQKDAQEINKISAEVSAYWGFTLTEIAAQRDMFCRLVRQNVPMNPPNQSTYVTLLDKTSAIHTHRGKDVVSYWFGMWELRPTVDGQFHLYGAVRYHPTTKYFASGQELADQMSDWSDFGPMGTQAELVAQVEYALAHPILSGGGGMIQTEGLAQRVLRHIYGLSEDAKVVLPTHAQRLLSRLTPGSAEPPVSRWTDEELDVVRKMSPAPAQTSEDFRGYQQVLSEISRRKVLPEIHRLMGEGGPQHAPISTLIDCAVSFHQNPAVVEGYTLSNLAHECRTEALNRTDWAAPEYQNRIIGGSLWSAGTPLADATEAQRWQFLRDERNEELQKEKARREWDRTHPDDVQRNDSRWR